jgi:hypothetical protein
VIHVPYATITHSPTATVHDYRAVSAALGDERPVGLLLLLVGHSEDGLHVVDVWTTQADADRFVAERLYPAFQRAGVLPGERDFHVESGVVELYVSPSVAPQPAQAGQASS